MRQRKDTWPNDKGTYFTGQQTSKGAPACSMRGRLPLGCGSRAPTDGFTASRGSNALLRKCQSQRNWPEG